MSQEDRRKLSFLQDLYTKCRGLEMLADGDVVKSNDRKTINDLIYLHTLALLDLFYAASDQSEHRRISYYYISIVKAVGQITDLLRFYKDCDSLLLNRECKNYSDFKRRVAKNGEERRILSLLKLQLTEWFSTYDEDAYLLLHQWFSFPQRLTITRETLHEEALNSYLEQEDVMTYRGDKYALRTIIQEWFSGFNITPETFRPKHGNGSTADSGSCIYTKYENLGSDLRINYLKLGSMRHDGQDQNIHFKRTSKLVFVPKSAHAVRSISMEPATLMWYQQGVLNAINSYIKQELRGSLGRRYRPEDQSQNREYAWIGSIGGEYATIDLSAASDSVNWDMIKDLFRRTGIYKWLLCTRSSHTELPNGETLALKKFAPMGSALCFPIEVIVFSAIAESVSRDYFNAHSNYCVYGDDIIIESELAHHMIERLEWYGFKVNQTKSFVNSSSDPEPYGWFRESCGGEFMNGHDVTPLRISRNFGGLSVDTASQLGPVLDLANRSYLRMPTVRRACIVALMQLRPSVFFSDDGECGVFSTHATNHHLKRRWSPVYQHFYVYSKGVKARYGAGSGSDDIRYHETLRLIQNRDTLTWPDDRVFVDPRSVTGIRLSFESHPVA